MFYLLYLLMAAGFNRIKNNLQQNLSDEQAFLKELTGRKFTSEEAEFLWMRISDHKWFISENLGRDVGFKVAAVDFFENIYRTQNDSAKSENAFDYQSYAAFSLFA